MDWSNFGKLLTPGGFLGAVGHGAFGTSPQDKALGYLDNEFRDISQSGFIAPGVPGAITQRGQLADQYGARGVRSLNAAQAGASGFGQDQRFLAGQLRNQFMGQGPGQEIVRRQAMEAQDRGLGQQQALLASSRGGNAALAGRTAAQQGSNITAGAANAAAMGGLNAQVQAGNMYGNVIGQARGQDEALNLANAQMRQNMGQFNVNSMLQNRQINDSAQLAALGQQQGLLGMQQAGMNAYQQARTGRYGTIVGAGMQAASMPNSQQLGLGFIKDAIAMGQGMPGAGGGGGGAPAPMQQPMPYYGPPGMYPG